MSYNEEVMGKEVSYKPADFMNETVQSLAAGQEVPDRVFFALNSFNLVGEARTVLEMQAKHIKANNLSVVVEGHCDERGTREYNLALGQRRASVVKSFLVSLGVKPSSIKTASYGKEKPISYGSNERSWALNRRSVTTLK